MTVIEPLEERPRDFPAGAFDEGFRADGAPRRGYAELFANFGVPALTEVAARVRSGLGERGVVFGGSDPRPFAVDAVPRIIDASEWDGIEHGLIQRVRALNAFLADVYGEQRAIAENVIPRRVIEQADWYEPAMAGTTEAGVAPVRAHVAGPDLVRGCDGSFSVLEDNLRAPSGLTYLLAARETLAPLLAASGLRPRGLDAALHILAAVIRSAAPPGVEDPCVVLLSDGPASSAYYEHRELSRRLGFPLVTMDDLRRSGERLMLRSDRGERSVDVLYRRIDDERLQLSDGTPTELGELLIEPIRAGNLGCANSPGSGVADDKAVHTYVDRLISFYLDEPILLPSVPGYDLGEPDQLKAALPRLGDLVIKPRSEFGGRGVLVGPLASTAQLEEATAAVSREPHRFVAQEPVALSLHPTICDGALSRRHVDLRPFVLSSAEETFVVPGGLTRFARDEGEMVVNSGRGGGAKDTWIL